MMIVSEGLNSICFVRAEKLCVRSYKPVPNKNHHNFITLGTGNRETIRG